MMDRQNCCICSALEIGLRFVPSAEDVLLEYLIPVIQRKPLPCNHLIKEADVYGLSSTPWEIFRDDDPYWLQSGSSNKKTMYVFTRLCKNGKRVLRRAGCGTWTGQITKKIKDKNGIDIGCRGAFSYKIDKKMNSNVESDDRWCMYEYTLDDDFLQKLGLRPLVQGYAICEIIKRCNNNDSEPVSHSNNSSGVSANLQEASNQHDTDFSIAMGQVNQILPVAQGVVNIDHQLWIVNGTNHLQAANPQHVFHQNHPNNISMLPHDIDRSIVVPQGVHHNVHVPDYQPATVNGNNQLSAANPTMNEGQVQSLIMYFATLPAQEFENFMQKLDEVN